MPIQFTDTEGPCAVFVGRCEPEEAEALLEWLRRTPHPCVDLAACGDLHTALAQLLFAASARLIHEPPNSVLTACLLAGGLLPDRRKNPKSGAIAMTAGCTL